MNIAILGWGSLLWDLRPEFDGFEKQHDAWQYNGPCLRLEFSRISQSRKDALTLVVESEPNGAPCTVAYAMSKRQELEDAICDLRCREGTTVANIGVYRSTDPVKSPDHQPEAISAIQSWAIEKKFEAVVWTNLVSNFEEKSKTKKSFSVAEAVIHLQSLTPEGKSKAAEYIWRAPAFIQAPLRTALQTDPWFIAQPKV